ncbi:metallophosphoesterase family protein [Parvularcula marina]|uniref:metallophosphoesterase family protein n=1 Tax=Parvularcula marina TaxID=2292771 RepID=UPI003517A71F
MMSAVPQTDMPEESPLLVAIGDIHGRADLLAKLLRRLEKKLRDEPYRLVFLGDYVDRGAESREVLNMLLGLQDRYPDTVFLRGNHEQAMLDFLAAPEDTAEWLEWGGAETLMSYGIKARAAEDLVSLQEEFANVLPDSHFKFLMSLPLYEEIGPYLFVHAGIDPHRPIEEQSERDFLWIREPFLQAEEHHFSGPVIVHGHTPVKKAENLPWRINLDTGAFWSSRLTAAILDGEKRRFVTT